MDANGYMRITIYSNGAYTSHYLHRMVAECYMDTYRPARRIQFRDNDPTNCHIDNLWQPPTVNDELEARRLARHRIHARRVRIIELDKVFRTAMDAARYIDGDPYAIYKCLRGERRSHKGYPYAPVNTQDSLDYIRRTIHANRS